MNQEDELNHRLACVFEGVGKQVGELVRCMVQAEIASHMARIQQLQAALTGQPCTQSDGLITEGETPAS